MEFELELELEKRGKDVESVCACITLTYAPISRGRYHGRECREDFQVLIGVWPKRKRKK